MTINIKDITVEDFKNYFKREFKYLIIFNVDTEYKKNVIVYYDPTEEFFQSLISKNKGNIPEYSPEQWEFIEEEYNDYINDDDIKKALEQARISFNSNIWGNNEDLLKVAFLLLTAHYLICDLNMSNGGGSSFFMTSKSVDGVSASYGIPQSILNNINYSYLAKTEFGLKYLQLLAPRLNGYIKTVIGTTSFM